MSVIASDHAASRDSLLSRLQLLNIEIMQAVLTGADLRRRELARERSQLRDLLERGEAIAA
jgi:type IV secretory pathway ATPase VirB11/archaellum biosynthesis ATPase